jgi:HEAT repeat protein
MSTLPASLFRPALAAVCSAVVLVWLTGPDRGLAAQPKDPPEAYRDVLGRPLPWGPEVRGVRLSVSTLRTRLLHGEPVEVWLHTLNTTRDGPYLRLVWEGPGRTVSVALTTEKGEAVPCTLELFRQGDGTPGSTHAARLWPKGKFADGAHLAPGRYRLGVTVEPPKDRADPLAWVGRLEGPPLTLEVLEGGPGARARLVPPKLRARAAALIRDLDARDFRTREAAEKALTPVALDALPLLEEAIASGPAEAATRARRLLRAALQPVLKSWSEAMGYQVWHEGGPVLAYLGEPSWQLVREHFRGQLPDGMRALAAMFGPVTRFRDPGRLSAAEKRQLAAGLADPDAAKRIHAVRSLPRTADEALLKALVLLLADPFSYMVPSECHPVPTFPVAHEAGPAVVRQGPAVIEPLIAFARARDSAARRTAARLLGAIGPDPRTLKYLGELLDAPEHEAHLGVLEALGKLGRAGVPLLRRIIEDPKRHPYLRRDAIPLLGKYGTAQADGPLLRGLLADSNLELVGAAARAVAEPGVKEALPALVRIARDEALDQNVRYAALAGVVRLAERKQAEGVLLGLADPRTHGGVRGHAMQALARLDCRRAIPAVLDALADGDWYVRATADHALRGFAALPAGVGYDAAQPDPARWRRWWEQQGK